MIIIVFSELQRSNRNSRETRLAPYGADLLFLLTPNQIISFTYMTGGEGVIMRTCFLFFFKHRDNYMTKRPVSYSAYSTR